MRFMMLMIPRGYEDAPAGTLPDVEMVASMARYNRALKEAGVLLALDGLHPPAMGARVRFSAGGQGARSTVVDGPFTAAHEVLGGYWMLQVKSKAEAVEWARRCPAGPGNIIEVRQVMEPSDFPPELQNAARS
ncbi:MAG TPA: YciI family protein [Polyangia bacterium]